MEYQWILDVLRDMKSFAQENGLTALAEQLDDTQHVALAEIAMATGFAGDFLGLDPLPGPGSAPTDGA